jgi:[ribosomal protein S5]-alanine N-acetyltransferase
MEIAPERLVLREFKQNDWPDILAYQKEPLYLRYYEWTERTPKAVEEFVQRFITNVSFVQTERESLKSMEKSKFP